MSKVSLPQTAVLLLASVLAGHGQVGAGPTGRSYVPAFISTINSTAGHTEVVVFPFRRKAFKIPIHSVSGPFEFSPDGTAVYGMCTPVRDASGVDNTKIAWCGVDLKTGETHVVQGSFQDRVPGKGFVPRLHPSPLGSARVRLFGLTPPDGTPKMISLPRGKRGWFALSLSPDGRRAVATDDGRAELIEIGTGMFKPLGDKLWIAAWSPDGKWLAALESGENGRTILMNAHTLKRERTLGHSELDWSPDSRYLLAIKPCGEDSGTLEAVDITTGRRVAVESSRCQVNQSTTGWVRDDIPEG